MSDKLGKIHEGIPCYDNGAWVLVDYPSREAFANDLMENYFKEPGEYAFDDTVKLFQQQAIIFREKGYYCEEPDGSKGFQDYWNDQKLKSRKGCFFKVGGKQWYLPRDYYFWINFVQIPDKVKRDDDFTDIWDSQLHMALYEWIGELTYKHGVVLKKRQFGSSLYHAAKLLNILWFEKSPVLKIGASLSKYVTGSNGTWKILQAYRIFLNKHTAWYRPMNPGGVGEWQQKIEYVENGRKTEKGRKGVLQALSFEQSDTAGVGGLCTLFFYEEAGIAKSMDKTYEFMRPALESGNITTGYFIAAGSVGDLKQCEPLKNYMYKPEGNGFMAVKNKWINNDGVTLMTGLFIPEQWSMPPFIDQYGNSQVEEALESIKEKRLEWKKALSPENYQIRVSQHPTNLEEAFAFRGDSIFPTQLISSQKRQIEEGDYPYMGYKLKYSPTGEVIATPTTKPPIDVFPVPKNLEDKTGVLQVWEVPDENKRFCQTYYASIDPVGVGKTSTSESLCSIYVYKTAVQVTRYSHTGDSETILDGDKIVATWCGRHDDLDQTHEFLCLIIEWYQAWTLVEVNISLFIQYMQFHRKHKYLVPSTQMVFTKDAIQSSSQHHSYGWRNVSTVFKNSVLPHLIAYLSEVLDEDIDDEGNVITRLHGISRIPDKMVMIEMEQWQPGVNVDRIVSLAALIAFVKIQEANRGLATRVENDSDETLHNSDNLYKFKSNPFKNIGGNRSSLGHQKSRNPFKNIN